MAMFDFLRNVKTQPRLVTANVLNMDTFLDFLLNLRLETEGTGHSTRGDKSEEYYFQVYYNSKPAAEFALHYIDNHFWPQKDGKNDYRDEDVRWRVIVSPVTINFKADAGIPEAVFEKIGAYSDEIVNDAEAKLAFSQYKQ
ncbi:MAG: hypothetical protein PHW54_06840 [Candidatus Omnitrophica bacterium]|nr:hypothetical protein [Candidatus Omnitrophota bacterium]